MSPKYRFIAEKQRKLFIERDLIKQDRA